MEGRTSSLLTITVTILLINNNVYSVYEMKLKVRKSMTFYPDAGRVGPFAFVKGSPNQMI